MEGSEMMEIVCYRNWSITIQCERCCYDCGPSRYKATALLSAMEVVSGHVAGSVVRLTGQIFETSIEANTSLLNEAKREIELRASGVIR